MLPGPRFGGPFQPLADFLSHPSDLVLGPPDSEHSARGEIGNFRRCALLCKLARRVRRKFLYQSVEACLNRADLSSNAPSGFLVSRRYGTPENSPVGRFCSEDLAKPR